MSDSILCPKCGGQTCVKDSRGDATKVYRRRQCLKEPGHRFSTYERIENVMFSKKFSRLLGELRKLAKLVS